MRTQPNPAPDPWRFALDAIEAGRKPVLVMVVDHSGSVPGVTGTFVVVTENGQAGTIGGGAAEHALVDRARGLTDGPTLDEFVHTEKGDGTLCNGVQRFCLLPLSSDDGTVIETILATLDEHDIGTLTVTRNGLGFERSVVAVQRFEEQPDWRFSTPLGLLDSLTIIGGGHVALALSRVMATLPFRITVLDNRTDLQTMDDNPWAHHTEVVDYDRIAEHVPEGDNSWVVVMTFGHRHDRQVVEKLLEHDVRYLGLMGSAAKIERLFADMEAAGADPEAVSRVRAPVGVAISSHTPEEIAVSVAAEIVGIRNGALD
jgi:xanthine dehydrogenase accessory factor